MNADERQQLHNRIASRLAELSQILDQTEPTTAALAASHDDESARLETLSHAPVDEALLRNGRDERQRLEANLEWLHGDDAGLCTACDRTIPLARLLAVPTTRLCIHCASTQA
ncbi:MAG TPA: TraR/DksA C4-type zinc finger protein [Spongiibacteraceae bacterium]|jgi:DnaK suppressor protein|nr:TraR/DksA C4-type zinc finger protein [Spongiibacteraceae bacterium]HUH38174.1 TraR/DksA C4-type zinc finger protein [Spongiibacteraceae bacterium]